MGEWVVGLAGLAFLTTMVAKESILTAILRGGR